MLGAKAWTNAPDSQSDSDKMPVISAASLSAGAPFPASSSAASPAQKDAFSYAVDGGFIRISFSKVSSRPGEKGDELYGLIELDLKDGWRTYWRNPGTSGFAPKVELSGGAKAELLYPAPILMREGEDWDYGYKGHISLPFRIIIPQNRQAVYTGNLLIGICENMCMPQKLAFSFSPGNISNKNKDELDDALAALPKPADKAFQLSSLKKVKGGLEAVLLYPAENRAAPQLFIDGGDAQSGIPEARGAAKPDFIAEKVNGKGASSIRVVRQLYYIPLPIGEAKAGQIIDYTAALPDGKAVSGNVKISGDR